MAGSALPDVVEKYIADVADYVRDVERAARSADHFGDQQSEAREAVQRFGHAAQEAAERAARSQAAAAREAEKLANGQGDVERAARAAAHAQRDLERAQMAQARAARAVSQQVDNEAEQYRELAREAARAAAAQQLAHFRASGQIREHNALLRRMRDEYSGFGRDGGHAFEEIGGRTRQTFEGLKNSGIKNVELVKAALVLLPLAAVAAAGAITLGVGGALSFIAIKAASKAKEVQKSFSKLKKDVGSELRKLAKPWEATLIHIAGYARSTFDEVGPVLKQVFTELAPAVDGFAKQFLAGFSKFKPVVLEFSAGFQKILADLGPRMDDILGNIADGLSAIAKAASENPEQFGQLIEDLSSLATLAGQVTAILAGMAPAIHLFSGAWSGTADAIGGAKGALSGFGVFLAAFASGPVGWVLLAADKTKQAFQSMGGATLDTKSAVDSVKTAYQQAAASTDTANKAQTTSSQLMKLASKSAKDLKASLDALAGKELGYREAMASYGEAVLQVNQSLRENGKSHGNATAKGIANERALSSLATTAQDAAVKMRENSKSAQEVARFMEGARQKFIKTAVAMGYHRKEAIALANKLYGVRNAANSIPTKRNMRVDANTEAARKKIRDLIAWTTSQALKMVLNVVEHKAAGGPVGYAGGGPVGIPGFPGGGAVRGPGTSTSDSILARLSNGEYVMTAAAARIYAPVLAMMNRVSGASAPRSSQDIRRDPGGRAPHAIEEGHYGIAPPPRTYAPLPIAPPAATIVQVHHNNFHIAGSVWAEKELLNVVQTQAAKRNIRNPGMQQFGSR